MNPQLDYIDELNATLTIEVSPDEYVSAANKSIEKLRKTANVPGFRVGKAPMAFIKKQYLKSVILDEVNKISDEKLQKFIDEKSVKMIGFPIVNNELTPIVEDVSDEITYKLVFDIGIVKEFELSINKDLTIPYNKIYVDDAILDSEISIIQKQHADFNISEVVNEHCMLSGLLILNKNEEIDAEPEKKQKYFLMDKLQSNPLLFAKFIGAKKNDTITITKEDIENINDIDFLISKDCNFEEVSLTYEISDIYITQEAELNEDLFKKVFPSLDINNIEDFRKELQSKIQLQYDSQSDLVFLRETIDKLIETVNVEMSETFLKKFIIHNNKDNEELIQDIEVNFDKYLKSVKQQFIEAKIFEVFDVKIGLDDYKDHIREFYKSAMNRTDVTDEQITSDLMQLLNDQQQKENLDEDVKNIKLIKVLKDNVSLSEIIHASYKDMINEFNKQNDKGKAVETDTESK